MVRHGKKTPWPNITSGYEYRQSGPLAVVENRVTSMEAEANFVLLDRYAEDNVNLIHDQSTDSFFRLLSADRFILHHPYSGHNSSKRSH